MNLILKNEVEKNIGVKKYFKRLNVNPSLTFHTRGSGHEIGIITQKKS
jgi:hypothetical protein